MEEIIQWPLVLFSLLAGAGGCALAFAGAFIWAIYATFTPSLSGGYDGTTIFFCCVAVVLWTIHFVSGDGLPDTAPGIGGYAALIACAASISGGYACWGYGMLHGSMETLAIGSYATPLFSTASSTLLLGVALGMPFWIGVALVVVGSLINATPLIVRFCRIGRLRCNASILVVRFSRIGQPGVTG